jgi:hypothetical protein
MGGEMGERKKRLKESPKEKRKLKGGKEKREEKRGPGFGTWLRP